MRRRLKHALALALPLLLIGAGKIDWHDMVESDWIYSIATRFSLVDGKKVHYPTPTAELARLLENRSESAALRHLAEAKLALGDRNGAWVAMTKWAEREGASAWNEAARWAMAHNNISEAFNAAEKAVRGLDYEDKRALCNERIRWADQYPEVADAVALMKARVELFPNDANALEAWLRRLEKLNRLDEIDSAIASTNVLDTERKLLLRSDLSAARKKYEQAFKILDDAVSEPRSMDFRRAYAVRVNQANPNRPQVWRTQLEKSFDTPALIRLCTWFQGQSRGDAATDLIRQMERRHESGLNRDQHLLLSRLYAEVDAIPEAFRAALAAAHLGNAKEQQDDLARLAHLALKAGGRPLSIGINNDEIYRWAALTDRTPGFWTGAISFLLTGSDFKHSLERLEIESLPDRTFATALALGEELVRRSSQHPDIPALRVALMVRHVDRGEGENAISLLSLLENTPSADEARKIALLAAHQTSVPIQEELRLMRARLKHLAPDGSKPTLDENNGHDYYEDHISDTLAWKRIPHAKAEHYSQTLAQYIGRLDHLDKSHQTSVSLILGEMDRMPDAEALWLHLADRLETWRLDDDLGSRYVQALQRFKGEEVWPRLTRWYAKRNYQNELKKLAEELTQRFRSSDIFARLPSDDVRLSIPEQPPIRDGVRMVPWADWVRFKALERFPHNPRIVREAQRLVTQTLWQSDYQRAESGQRGQNGPLVVPDDLIQTKQWAVFFVEPDIREAWFREAMKSGNLVQKLEAVEAQASKTPVDDVILCEGWSRLSQYEKAVPAAERLSVAYPDNENMAGQTLSLYRSLNGLGYNYIQSAHALVARTAPCLEHPYNLLTELGEIEEERGRPDAAINTWRALLEREPRNTDRISELATLLWDYNHDREALNVVEEGRKRINRPTFFAFETGVLRENLRDINGAIREYLAALQQEEYQSNHYSADQRALGRIAQLLSRRTVYNIVEKLIQDLRPGQPDDEKRLLSFFPLMNERVGRLSENDDWIDFINNPNDAVGQEIAAQKRAEIQPDAEDAIRRIGNLILAKTESMTPKASTPDFLEACQTWMNRVAQNRWKPDRLVSYENIRMARHAELAVNAEDRIRIEMERADYLVSKGRNADADLVWSQLETHIAPLPDGATKMKAETARASYLERSSGTEAAAAEWKRLSERYPWSFGLLEDRLAFLRRTGALDESRALLEDASNRAGEGYRVPLLQQLARDCVAENDISRAHRATQRLLQEANLSPQDRLEAVKTLARLSIKADSAWDSISFVTEQSASFAQEYLPDLYYSVATAADAEGAHKTAFEPWVEALNRRADRQWVQSACRSAMAGGVEKELLSFFERQQQRSPRDVRWAVVVRDISRNLYMVDETIQAAKAAVAIRPSSDELWREAAEIMVFADKVKEAADYLEGWHKLRPSDESVAIWRARLYAQAGEDEQAFAVEKATLDAFQKESKNSDDYANRRARAAIRLMENGLIKQSLRIYSQQGDILAVTKSKIPGHQQARMAIYSGQLVKLLQASVNNENMLNSIADELDSHGKPEDRELIIKHLVPQLSVPMPARAAALNQWHNFIRRAGIGDAFRLVAAQEYVSAKSGPWQQNTSAPFLQKVGDLLIPSYYNQNDRNEPELELLWVDDLVRRDGTEELATFMEPGWKEAMEIVFGNSGVEPGYSRPNWSKLLESQHVLETWARGASQKPEMMQQLNNIMSERRLWDRFWAVAARNWKPEVLIDLVNPVTRTTWFRFWNSELRSSDPVIQARAKQTENVSEALGWLIQGKNDTASNSIITKLRGPQTVGELLGNDTRWIWSEFTPRTRQGGTINEPEEYRSVGTGIDTGRFPAAFWGQNPSEAWYVMETLIRYRNGDRTAPLLPLESTQRGNETARTLSAVGLARKLGDINLAVELDSQHPGSETDMHRVQTRILLLNASNEHEKAITLWKKHITSRQKNINSTELSELSHFAIRNNLPDAIGLFDTSQPLHPELLASLVASNVDTFKSYKASDIVAFRSALAERWTYNESGLNSAQLRFWLRELWATGSAELPRRLNALGGLWGLAHPWLSQQAVPQRIEALNAVESGGETLINLLRQSDKNDVNQILMARVHLAAGNSNSALSLVEQWIRENSNRDLGQARISEGQDLENDEYASYYQYDSSLVERIRFWVNAFSSGPLRQNVADRFSGMLREHYESGAVSQDVWVLAFDLCKQENMLALCKALEHAWFRGQLDAENLGGLIRALAKYAPQDVPKWLKRWPLDFSFQHTTQRASILAALKRPGDAAQVYKNARWRASWRTENDLNAFNAWQRLDAGQHGPELWQKALARRKGTQANSLTAQLRAHPMDCFSAALVLETPKGANEEEMVRVEQAIKPFIFDSDAYVLLRIKTARNWLPISRRTAVDYIEGYSLETYYRAMVSKKLKSNEINGALADLARIYHHSGDIGSMQTALRILSDRNSPDVRTLRTELDRVPVEKIVDYHMVNDRLTPILPKDLTWSSLNKFLQLEGKR